MKEENVIIIGSGPAGYTAAIYAARANLKPVMFTGFFSGPAGGQLMTTTEVENYPGFPEGVMGPELVDSFHKQAQRFGTEMIADDCVEIDLTTHPYTVIGKKEKRKAKAIIVATGAYAKRLDIPGTRDGELWQKGVTACAVCDGAMPIFRNRELYVIGGGDSAVEEATFLTKFGSKVYIVHRRDELRASKIMCERALSNPKIEILWDSVIEKVEGNGKVEKVIIKNLKSGKEEVREAGGVFFAVGHKPNTDFLAGKVDLYENGYIKTLAGTTRTSVEFVFACGDAMDYIYRQAITAAGTGCMAALDAERELAAKGLAH